MAAFPTVGLSKARYLAIRGCSGNPGNRSARREHPFLSVFPPRPVGGIFRLQEARLDRALLKDPQFTLSADGRNARQSNLERGKERSSMRVIGFASAARIMTHLNRPCHHPRGDCRWARAVILNEEMNATCGIAGASRNVSDEAPFAQKTMRHLPMLGRSATPWIAAAMLATSWVSETQASPDQARHLADAQHAMAAGNFDSNGTAGYGEALPPSGGVNDRSVQVVQATTSDAGQSPEQEHHSAETLSVELTNARRDIELLQRLEQEHDRAEWLEQDLAAARRDVETQTARAAKASEEASRLKLASESSAAELQKSLQQERERAERLERDLAGARRDAEAQTALATKASEEIQQRKQAETGAAELNQPMQKERETAQDERKRAERLAQDLAAARRDVETQTALAAKATEEASRLKQASESSAMELQKSPQQEHDRTERLEQDLAAARRDVETQTVLAAKASEEASRLKQASESSAAELQKSLQQEHDRAERLEQDLAAARRDVGTQTALAAKASEETSRLKQASESSAAELQKSLQQEHDRAERLERDLAAARRDVEAQTALAAEATKEIQRRKQAEEAGAAELRQSMQKERERADALAQDLSMTRSAIYAYEVQARKAGDQASELRQAAANGTPSLRKSAQDGRDRTAQPEPDLALPKHAAPNAVTVGSIARDKPTENAKPVADRALAAGVRGDARLNSEEAAAAAGLVARASALLVQGDIGAARVVLERAVEMGSAQASFSLAETYDPLVLAKWGTYGTRGDAIKAQALYAKAAAAGIEEAKARFEALHR
jgi:hypothetical protein